jgi:hypothetical protein
MKRLYVTVIASVAVAVTTSVVGLYGSAGTTNVTSQLQIPANSAAPVFFSDAGQSGTDEYVTTAGKNPVYSVLQSSGDWQLDTQSVARAVWLDLDDPSVPFDARYVHSLLTTHCATTNASPVGSLTGGQSTNCGMSFRINWGTDSSVYYRIHFNSVLHPGTGDVKFTCNNVPGAACSDWTATPADNDGNPDGRSTGLLVKVTTARNGTETETPIGYYPVNFAMHITKP